MKHIFITLPPSSVSESCIKIKMNLNFCYHTFWCLMRFKTFRSTTKKCGSKNLMYFFHSGLGREGFFNTPRMSINISKPRPSLIYQWELLITQYQVFYQNHLLTKPIEMFVKIIRRKNITWLSLASVSRTFW